MIGKAVNDKKAVLTMLGEIIPFRFLSGAERTSLQKDLHSISYAAGEQIYARNGKSSDVYILLEGSVETVDESENARRRVNLITANHYFGERACLFNSAREYSVRALEISRGFSMSGERFLQLVHESRTFAQALGNILREKQGVFGAFDRFSAELMQGLTLGHVDIKRLLPHYVEIGPALHPGALSRQIDFNALRYAIVRLPDNVTRNFVYLLTDDLPYEYSLPDETFQGVPTKSRRRNVWEMLPGKSMILLRSGLSDLIDFVSCLCLYAVEARKIREKLADPRLLLAIEQNDEAFLSELPFEANEISELKTIWPDDSLERLKQIAFHQEALSIDIRRQTDNYISRRTDLWTQQIGSATKELLGCDPNELPDDAVVHIISSNTHSVTNCLNPYLAENADEIVEWAASTGHPEASVKWSNPFDLVYAVSQDYIRGHAQHAALHQVESEWGMLRLRKTVSTGIEVQLMDLNKLRGHTLDPDIGELPDAPKTLLVNIDYAFGEQAEEIIRHLIMLFGRNLASINVLGKAGALVGERGDILVPSAFIEQTTDLFHPFPDCVTCNTARLTRRIEKGTLHTGPLLTVAGTLLQNSAMLNFYKHIWGCIGLEMEGTFYYRQILESQQLGVIRSGIPLRFLYYVSDLPLDRTADLSARLSAVEGIPPLYAITREILSEIFDQERVRIGAG